jgi:probable phosphoglycerate mutase
MDLDLLLVRHAETACVLRGAFCGDCDTPLTEQGAQTAGRVAAALGEGHFGTVDVLVSSPAVRSVQTAQAIIERLGLPLRLDPRWAELRFGRWEGLTANSVDRRAWSNDPVTIAPPGGEPGAAVLARAVSGLHDLAVAHPGGRVVVVSHKHVIRLLLAHAGDVPLRAYRAKVPAPPGSLSVLQLNDQGLRVINGARLL